MRRLDLPLRGPGGEAVDLVRTLASHGFADLPPVALDQSAATLEVTLRPRRGAPRRIRLSRGRPGRVAVEILGPETSSPRIRADMLSGARHVLRLDQDLSGFYEKATEDPDLAWAATGAGRMLQSPTVFEDVVKTMCTTNCSWGLTQKMVTALVTGLGDAALGGHGPATNAFPTPAAMAGQPERYFREVVRAGYRAPYLRALSGSVASGEVDLEALADTTPDELPDDELERRLLALSGIGPYAAAHIMMTLGRNSRLILDSWTRPTYAKLVGRRSVSDDSIERRFRRYGDHAGLAFWLFVTRDWVE